MKSWHLRLPAVLLALAGAFSVCSLFTPAASRCDFNYRMAEIECVRRGVDPFLVWSEKVVLKPYYSNNPGRKSIPEGCDEQISVYVPWEYLLMAPLSFMERDAAWWFFAVFSILSSCMMIVFSGRRSKIDSQSAWKSLAVCPMLCVIYPLWSNLMVGNHIAVVLAAAFFMAFALERGKDILAGLCWMLLMIKPQIGLVFAVPLVLRMKVLAGTVAVFACVILSIPAAVICDVNLFSMLVEPAEASAFAFEGCGTWPKFLCGYFPREIDIAVGLGIGAGLCLWMTWMLRREKDYLVYLMPAAVCASCWTYTQAYSHAMGWFLAYAVVKELLLNPRSKAMWVLALASAVVLPRFILAWHGLYGYMGWNFPMSEFAYRSLDSLNSTCTLALAAAFCLVKAKSTESTVS